MALVTQSFGNPREYRRAIFAILSYYAHHDHSRWQKTVLFTDNPGYFKTFTEGLPVHFEMLTPERIAEMRGKIDFLHRMKIAIIEHAFNLTQENLLYVDSDTFFMSESNTEMDQLSQHVGFMHLIEYSFKGLMDQQLADGNPVSQFVKLITSQKFVKADGSPISVDLGNYSWNAGVMMLHKSVLQLLPDVYVLTDQFYPSTQDHACEQFAFSIVLQNSIKLRPCDNVVYHYWYRVKKKIIDIFLEKRLTEKWKAKNLHENLKTVKEWTDDLPQTFESDVLMLRDRAVQAFCENNYRKAYAAALRAIAKNPLDLNFFNDIFYHTKRFIKGQH
jgi:hypothetical protein